MRRSRRKYLARQEEAREAQRHRAQARVTIRRLAGEEPVHDTSRLRRLAKPVSINYFSQGYNWRDPWRIDSRNKSIESILHETYPEMRAYYLWLKAQGATP